MAERVEAAQWQEEAEAMNVIPAPDEVQRLIRCMLGDCRGSDPGPTSAEIAESIGLPESVVSSVIDLMHATGIVKYTPERPATVRWRLR